MQRFRATNGIFLVVLLAALGALMVYVPGKVITEYARVKALGPPYTYLYLAMVGTGAAILLPLAGGIFWKLWQATRAKAQRRDRGAKDHSQLTDEEKRREVADNLARVEDLQTKNELPDELR